MSIDIEDLQHDLATPDVPLGRPDLPAIRRLGRRRRRARRLATGAGGLAVAGAVAGIVVGISGSGGVVAEDPPASTTIVQHRAPQTMHPLAARALREIPGAVRVSATQVVIPGPGVPEESDLPIGHPERDSSLVGTPVDLPGHAYGGVTIYPRSAFPAWLHEGIADYEETVLGDDQGHPVGSTDIGILVDQGVAELGCTTWHASERHDNADCAPSLLTELAGDRYLEWGMGTDSFLRPGSRMEVFLSDDFSTGRPSTLAIAGLDGTRVVRVDFVTTDGARVEGTVQSGTITEGDSLFYANVPGALVAVVAYDARGDVIEDHEIRPCASPVDCEVR